MAKPTKSKRFKYNLQTVLKVRKIRETQEQEKFQAAQKKLEEERLKEQQLKDQQAFEYAELRNKIQAGEVGDVGDIQRRKAHLDQLKIKVEEQTQKRIDAEEALELQRQALIKAVKDRKIIEKDKEKKREIWKKFMDKEEAKFLDDIATIGYTLKKMDREEDGEDA